MIRLVRTIRVWWAREELRASAQFLVILLPVPFLPDRELDVLLGVNPRVIWGVAVFIAGLSLLGYALSKVLRPTRAIGVEGLLGGSVSPSLTVAALSEQTRRQPDFTTVYAFAAAVASCVLFPRIFVLVWIVSPSLALSTALPLGGMTGAAVAVTTFLWFRARRVDLEGLELDTPFRVAPALAIAGIVAAIWAAVNLLGLQVPSPLAETGIVLAVVGNLLGMVGIAWMAGARTMAWAVGLVWVASTGVGMALVLLV